MLFDEVIMGRRSIRGYKPDPVPKDVIREIITLATRAVLNLDRNQQLSYLTNL